MVPNLNTTTRAIANEKASLREAIGRARTSARSSPSTPSRASTAAGPRLQRLDRVLGACLPQRLTGQRRDARHAPRQPAQGRRRAAEDAGRARRQRGCGPGHDHQPQRHRERAGPRGRGGDPGPQPSPRVGDDRELGLRAERRRAEQAGGGRPAVLRRAGLALRRQQVPDPPARRDLAGARAAVERALQRPVESARQGRPSGGLRNAQRLAVPRPLGGLTPGRSSVTLRGQMPSPVPRNSRDFERTAPPAPLMGYFHSVNGIFPQRSGNGL